MKTAIIPQIRVEPELRAELEAALQPGETITSFVETAVRKAVAYSRMQNEFHARAEEASRAYHATGESVPVDQVLDKLRAKLKAKRQQIG